MIARLLLVLAVVAAPGVRTHVMVMDGAVEVSAPAGFRSATGSRSATGFIVIGPGEAAAVGEDGRVLYLGQRTLTGQGPSITRILPLEGDAWMMPLDDDEVQVIEAGEIGLATDKGIRLVVVDALNLAPFIDDLKGTLSPGSSVGTVYLSITRRNGRRIGIDVGDSRSLIIPPAGWTAPSTASPLVNLIFRVVDGETSLSGFPPRSPGLAPRATPDEASIRRLFHLAVNDLEHLRFSAAGERVLPEAKLDGRPYGDFRKRYLERAEGMPPILRTLTALKALKISWFLSRVRLSAPDRGEVDIVGSALCSGGLPGAGTFTISGSFRFQVRRVGSRWFIGNGHVSALVVDSSLLSFTDFGIVR